MRSLATFRAAAVLSVALCTQASVVRADADAGAIHLELPTVDVTCCGAQGHPLPSMRQSLWVTTDVYQLVGYGLGRLVDPFDEVPWKKGLGRALVATGDFLITGLPFGLFWQHEEWHRAVLTHRGIHSHDDVYDLRFWEVAVNVSDLRDADLARFKADHPAEFVRMSTAGIEASYELATNLEKVQFFHRTRTWNVAALWQAYVVNSVYQYACAGSLGDRFTDQANQEEGADPRRRDFTGADCTAWVYDLFRPQEPYAARGVHPSGVGIDRYRKFADATPEEQRYLRTQFGLSLLNFLDPALLGFDAFTLGRTHFNAHVRTMPTSFGSVVQLDAFIRGPIDLFVSAQVFRNHVRAWPGLSGELVRHPIARKLHMGARAAVWLQPLDQGFFDDRARVGGLLSLRVGANAAQGVEPWVEIEAKSAGWVAGNLALDPAFSMRAGLVAALF